MVKIMVPVIVAILAIALENVNATVTSSSQREATSTAPWAPFHARRNEDDTTKKNRQLNIVEDGKNIDGVFVINATNTAISGKVVWTKARTPVIRIEGDMLNITETGSLTIRRGVRVLFAGRRAGIRNSGLLRILGRPKDRVTLQALPTETPDDDLWRGIIFNETAVGAVVEEPTNPFDIPTYVEGSILQSTDIQDAAVDVKRRYPDKSQAVLEFNYGNPPYLKDVNLVDCGGHCLRVFRLGVGSSLVASSVQLKIKEMPRRSNYQELFVQGRRKGPSTSGNVVLHRVTAVNDDRTYESLLQGLQSVTIRDSLFDDIHLTRVTDTSSTEESRKYSHISSSQFLHGLNLAAVHGAVVEKNLFGEEERPPTRAFYADSLVGWQVSDIWVRNNTFELTGPVTIFPILPTTPTSAIDGKKPAVRVTSNAMRNLRVRDGTFNLWSIPTSDNYLCDVSENVIENSTIGNMVTFIKSEGPATQAHCQFRKNVFVNSNNATYSVVALEGFSTPVAESVRVPQNYWGKFQNDIVQAKRRSVQDVLTTTQGAYVDFHSVLSKPNGRVKLVDGAEGPFLSNGSLGGFLVGNSRVVLEDTGTVLATLSLVVSTDATLVIGSNVDIQFATGAGIVVLNNGVLDVRGGGVESTKLRPQKREDFVRIQAHSTARATIRSVRLEGLVEHTGSGALLIDKATISYESRNWREPECVRSTWTSDDDAYDEDDHVGTVTITKSALESCSVKVVRRPVITMRNTRIGQDSRFSSVSKMMQVEKCSLAGDLVIDRDLPSGLHPAQGTELFATENFFIRGYVRVEDCGVEHIVVEDNDFTTLNDDDNPCSGLDVDSNAKQCVSDIVFRGNTLHDMRCTLAIAPVQLYFEPERPGKYGGLVIHDNEFRNIRAGRMLYLNVYRTLNPFNVGGNYFSGDCMSTATRFAAGLVVFRFWPEECSGVGLDAPLCTFRNNTFESSTVGTTFDLASVWDTKAAIDASYNYWGHDDAVEIARRMSKDFSYQRGIRFEPFRLAPPETGSDELFPPCAVTNDCGGFGGVCLDERHCSCDDGKTRDQCTA